MSERDRLRQGLDALGLELPATAVDRLLAYRDLLLKWNRTYNLTALKDPEQMLVQHLLDSLAILPWIAGPELLDVGSGAGLPGIPLAIARPDLRVTLVDAVQKKAAFQRQAAIELGLANVEARHARVEALSGQYGIITARAFAELAEFVRLTRPLLAPGGRWLAMKGQLPERELASLPADVRVAGLQPLKVPGLDAARHLVILEAS
ncbi:MAG: 16S rRNA (guanine(527)-N(7))-methyltransferase RsmG [Azovibrio sp.]|nr:16S rRNA (guanine(527)-N(7))-methyltransferase RsmG [Azovibrio sp.]